MIGLLTGGVVKYIAGGVIIAVLGVAGTYYYTTEKRIEQLKNEVVQTAIENQTLQDNVSTLSKVTQQQRDNAKSMKQLNRQLVEQEAELNRLKNILFDHDLTRLSIEKPGLIEKRVNDGTKKVFEDLVDITGNDSITQ